MSRPRPRRRGMSALRHSPRSAALPPSLRDNGPGERGYLSVPTCPRKPLQQKTNSKESRQTFAPKYSSSSLPPSEIPLHTTFPYFYSNSPILHFDSTLLDDLPCRKVVNRCPLHYLP